MGFSARLSTFLRGKRSFCEKAALSFPTSTPYQANSSAIPAGHKTPCCNISCPTIQAKCPFHNSMSTPPTTILSVFQLRPPRPSLGCGPRPDYNLATPAPDYQHYHRRQSNRQPHPALPHRPPPPTAPNATHTIHPGHRHYCVFRS